MRVVQLVENRVPESARDEALARIRDAYDWQALALGLRLECAIWKEERTYLGPASQPGQLALWSTIWIANPSHLGIKPEQRKQILTEFSQRIIYFVGANDSA
jgi:hypothetical protein